MDGSNNLQARRVYLDTVDSVFARVSSSGTAAWYLPGPARVDPQYR